MTDAKVTKEASSVFKKRGRKPKGGKIIPNNASANSSTQDIVKNVILHLKCFRNDLEGNGSFGMKFGYSQYPHYDSASMYTKTAPKNSSTRLHSTRDLDENKGSKFASLSVPLSSQTVASTSELDYDRESQHSYAEKNDCAYVYNESQDVEQKGTIEKKLHDLQYNFHNNTKYSEKSDCFWCTCSFETPPVYIPTGVGPSGTYSVYGNFCMPECAVAYLMNEYIDSSIKYERYALIHNLYHEIYQHDDGFKPAPAPYYTLDKYYGNLTIEEYRSLHKTSKLILVINKPITKIFPEIHEDNTNFVMKSKTIPTHAETDSTFRYEGNKTSLSNFVIRT